MLTISRLSRWSIKYYNDTANQAKQHRWTARRAGGGLGEYYSEGDTRAPTWLVVGDVDAVGEPTGLDGAALHGGFADTETVARWLDDGDHPERGVGAGVRRRRCARFRPDVRRPQECVAAAGAARDDVTEKILLNAHNKASKPRWPTCINTPATRGCITR